MRSLPVTRPAALVVGEPDRARRAGRSCPPGLRLRRIGALVVAVALLAGCAQGYVNRPLARWQPGVGHGETPPGEGLRAAGRSDELLVLLSFSGGGARAAAFSYGVLEHLARTSITLDGRTRRLSDEIDVISAVSGGSFTAAYFGLFGDRIFREFKPRFLDRNIHRSIILRWLLPHNWIRFLSPRFGRSDLVAEYLDRTLFEGKTFDDLEREGHVGVLVTAADMPVGARFGFVQSQFDLICSDLGPFPVARAVAASSAVPLILTPVVLRNYAGSCGYAPPDWTREALAARDTTSRRFHTARVHHSYLDARARPYIHLVDGGVADNVGLRALLEPVFAGTSFWQLLLERRLDATRHVVAIIVDAETAAPESSGFWQWSPSLAQVIDAVTDTQIRLYSYESIDLVRSGFERWEQERLSDPAAPGHPVSFHIVHVAFEAHRDPRTREALSSLPFTLNLQPEAVDALRRSAAEILDASVAFRRFIEEIDDDAAPESPVPGPDASP